VAKFARFLNWVWDFGFGFSFDVWLTVCAFPFPGGWENGEIAEKGGWQRHSHCGLHSAVRLICWFIRNGRVA